MANKKLASQSFYSHHSAWGSYASFTVGKYQSGAGFSLGGVQPPSTSLYVGYRVGKKGKPRLLPFTQGRRQGVGAENYVAGSEGDAAGYEATGVNFFKDAEIERTMDWATERWRAGCMDFSLATPFGPVHDPERSGRQSRRFDQCPAVFARLEFDNSAGKEELVGVFALQGMRRPLGDATGGGLAGAADGTRCGFATQPRPEVAEVLDFDVLPTVFEAGGFMRRLGMGGGLLFRVPAGEKLGFDIVLGSYLDGVRTSGYPTRLAYTKLFADLEDVLAYGLANRERYLRLAADRDAELRAADLNDQRKFLVAHATRSYFASTEYLLDAEDRGVFVVNEGEYQMINTLDLTVDQAFWELRFSPWTVRNELDFFLRRYSYKDKKGLAFTHDQGVADMFTPRGVSSYELADLKGCFSHMSHEELLNWLLTAALYVGSTGDRAWLAGRAKTFRDILKSLAGRDENGDGIMDWDSDRCASGSEITTYDSLDVSLGQARNNLYLGVKTWAGYVCLGRLFGMLNEDKLAKQCERRAALAAATIAAKFDSEQGYIPAVFEQGNASRIIPAAEGLAYPHWLGDADAVSEDGRFGGMVRALKAHLKTVLAKGVCLDPASGGWKLSSTSNNTWLSKIYLNQYVVQTVLGMKYPAKDWDAWDKAHAAWQTVACADFAATDQVDSATGKDLGSRLYPRLVTSILWL